MMPHSEIGTKEDVLQMIETATELIDLIEEYCSKRTNYKIVELE